MTPRCHYLQSAVERYREGLYDEAIDLAKLALEEQPALGKAWELVGMSHHAAGNDASAIHALEVATLLVPLSAVGQCVLSKCYMSRGHRELAGDMLRHLLSLDTLPPKLLPAIAAGLGSLGDLAMALEACRRAAAAEVDEGQPLYGMAH